MFCNGPGPYWWIFPLVFFGLMILCSFVFARRGRRSWCSPFRSRSGGRESIKKLEEEVQSLKDQLTEQSLMK
jgi:hypothetical protein